MRLLVRRRRLPTSALRTLLPRLRSTPRRLVAGLLRWRARRGLESICALAVQKDRLNVWTLCNDYCDDDYDAMDDDANRNAAYQRAFDAAAQSGCTEFLEIGCGASATLTRLALRAGRGTRVTAFEVNPHSAAAAARQLAAELGGAQKAAQRAAVVVGRSTSSTDSSSAFVLGHSELTRRFEVLVHEVFGLFASSEGGPRMLAHARAAYLAPQPLPGSFAASAFNSKARKRKLEQELKGGDGVEGMSGAPSNGGTGRLRHPPSPAPLPPAVVPARCATFFTPCWLRPAALGRCETVCCSSARRPKVLLAPAAPLPAMALAHGSAAFEAYDFRPGAPIALEQAGSSSAPTHLRTSAPLHPRAAPRAPGGPAPSAPPVLLGPVPTTRPRPRGVLGAAAQERTHEFAIRHAGELNCLGCFLWVDLGIGEPSPGGTAAVAGGGSGLESTFPFGDQSALSLLPTLPGEPRLLNDFTSLCCDDTQANHTYVSKWQNPLLLLPRPARVAPGDTVHVITRAAADSLRPTYRFEAKLQRAGGGDVSLGSLEASLDALCPNVNVNVGGP